MTIPISDVLTVSISRQTQFPQGPGFGTPLIVGPDTTGVITLDPDDRVRSYSSIDGVAADFAPATEEYKAAQTAFSQNPRLTQLKIGVRDTAAGALADEMDAIVDVDNDWYAVMLTAEARVSDDAGLTAELAAWVEPRRKLFVVATNEADALAAGGGIAATLKASNLHRTGVFYHQDADSDAANAYPEAGALGQMLTVDFDGVNTTRTLKGKRLAGVSTSPLTQNELDNLRSHNGNAHVIVGETPMVVEGKMASGEFFDTMHGVDWLEAEIAKRVFGRLVTMPKVPYTDAGMAILENEVRLALQQGVNNGLLAPKFDDDGNLLDAFEVSTPSVLSQSEANRSARIAPPISFEARLAGAVHFASVAGTVTI